jgi:hypothetical protein
MTPLETLAAAIGFTPPEGEALTVEMVLDAVMEFIDADEGDAQSMAAAVATGERPSLRDIHSMVADVHAAERDRPASAEALANIDALSATATQLAERIAVADRFESIADLDALPEPPAPAEPEAVTPPATPGDAGAPADAAPSTAPAGSAQPAPDAPAPAVVARRGQPGEQTEIREGALTDAIAAAVSSRTDQRIEIDMELRSGTAGTPGVSAMAAAVTIGGQEFGYCGFPAMDDSITVCGTSEWPEAVAYQSLSTPRLPGQPVLRHNPIRSTNGEGFIWSEADREAQLLRDNSGDLVLDGQGRPQLDPDAPVKPSVPVICDDDVLTADQMFGRSRVVDAVYPPAKLSALIQTMLNDQVRDAARQSLSWMASQANWQEPGATILSMANRQNAAARFIEGITSALPRIAAPQGVNEIATDLFVPVWFPSVFSGEDYLRPEYIETWATLLAKLTERGVTVRPSLDHFVDTSFDGVSATIATQLTGEGLSTWQLPNFTAGGTIAVPGTYAGFPTSVPIILAESGSVTVDIEPFIAVNMSGTPQPVGQSDLRGNRRTLFTESTAYRHHSGCSPLIGLSMCLDPKGVTSAPASPGAAICGPA